jgi:hypothetical protein
MAKCPKCEGTGEIDLDPDGTTAMGLQRLADSGYIEIAKKYMGYSDIPEKVIDPNAQQEWLQYKATQEDRLAEAKHPDTEDTHTDTFSYGPGINDQVEAAYQRRLAYDKAESRRNEAGL